MNKKALWVFRAYSRYMEMSFDPSGVTPKVTGYLRVLQKGGPAIAFREVMHRLICFSAEGDFLP